MMISIQAIGFVLAAPFIGSFLGMLAYRLPSKQPIVFSRSKCINCHAVLRIGDLVPVVSWLAAGGRCRHCGEPVSSFYPVLELGALVIAIWSAMVLPPQLIWVGCLLGWSLLLLSVLDLQHFLLPDAITLPLIAFGLGITAWLDPGRLLDHVIGASAGFLIFLLISVTYCRLRRREGLGGGDAKLAAAAGAWISWEGLPGVVLFAALLGLIAVIAMRVLGAKSSRGGIRLDDRIPFGPFLSLGLWLVWLYGPLTFGAPVPLTEGLF